MKVKEESEKIGLKLNIQKTEVKTTTTTTTTEIMESSPIISWQIEGGKVEAVTDFIFLGSHWRIDAFELWCWRRLLRVPWTARKSNQSILREISPEYSLEGLMLKLKLHLSLATWLEELTHLERPWCWERLKVGGEGNDKRWDGWMASLTRWTWIWASSRSWRWTGKPGVLQSMGSQRAGHNWATELNWRNIHSINVYTMNKLWSDTRSQKIYQYCRRKGISNDKLFSEHVFPASAFILITLFYYHNKDLHNYLFQWVFLFKNPVT